MGFWCVAVGTQCSIYRRLEERAGGGEPGVISAPLAARTDPLLQPLPAGMVLAVGSTRLHCNRPCVRGPRHPPPRVPADLGPGPGSARQHALPEEGGRRGRPGGLRVERSNTLFVCQTGSVRRGGGMVAGPVGGAAVRLAVSARWACSPRQSGPPPSWLRLATPEYVAGGGGGGEGLGASLAPTRRPLCGWHLSSAAAPCRPGHFCRGGGTDTAGTQGVRLGPTWGRVRDQVRALRPSRSCPIPPHHSVSEGHSSPPLREGSITPPLIRLLPPRHLPLPVRRPHRCGSAGVAREGRERAVIALQEEVASAPNLGRGIPVAKRPRS